MGEVAEKQKLTAQSDRLDWLRKRAERQGTLTTSDETMLGDYVEMSGASTNCRIPAGFACPTLARDLRVLADQKFLVRTTMGNPHWQHGYPKKIVVYEIIPKEPTNDRG